jgi:hypothetical protein
VRRFGLVRSKKSRYFVTVDAASLVETAQSQQQQRRWARTAEAGASIVVLEPLTCCGLGCRQRDDLLPREVLYCDRHSTAAAHSGSRQAAGGGTKRENRGLCSHREGTLLTTQEGTLLTRPGGQEDGQKSGKGWTGGAGVSAGGKSTTRHLSGHINYLIELI